MSLTRYYQNRRPVVITEEMVTRAKDRTASFDESEKQRRARKPKPADEVASNSKMVLESAAFNFGADSSSSVSTSKSVGLSLPGYDSPTSSSERDKFLVVKTEVEAVPDVPESLDTTLDDTPEDGAEENEIEIEVGTGENVRLRKNPSTDSSDGRLPPKKRRKRRAATTVSRYGKKKVQPVKRKLSADDPDSDPNLALIPAVKIGKMVAPSESDSSLIPEVTNEAAVAADSNSSLIPEVTNEAAVAHDSIPSLIPEITNEAVAGADSNPSSAVKIPKEATVTVESDSDSSLIPYVMMNEVDANSAPPRVIQVIHNALAKQSEITDNIRKAILTQANAVYAQSGRQEKILQTQQDHTEILRQLARTKQEETDIRTEQTEILRQLAVTSQEQTKILQQLAVTSQEQTKILQQLTENMQSEFNTIKELLSANAAAAPLERCIPEMFRKFAELVEATRK